MKHRVSRGTLTVAALACSTAGTAQAQQNAATEPVQLAHAQQVEINGHYDNAVGTSDAASEGVIRAPLLKSRPALRPGEVLEFVPGVIVTQHSGDGKANQYFLRGFNLDHGADFATTVNGVPVNMPTHGHGQGYSDLNFLIPELVQRIEYRKGPYFARKGDFASAGSADIVYQSKIDASFAAVTVGENNHRRLVGGGSSAMDTGQTLSGAVELAGNDGPWTVPEGLRKSNAVLSIADGDNANGWRIGLMAYDARWTSTDQVPQRLIDAGSFNGQPFGRFDSIDPTDGGSTGRYSLSGQWQRRGDSGSTEVGAYALRYRLALYSNFTYALDRPATGDQFSQQDKRSVYGVNALHSFEHTMAGLNARTEFGTQIRHDRIRVGLFETQARQINAVTRDDRVRETSLGVYAQTALELAPWARTVLGVRADRFGFDVEGLSDPANSGHASDTQLSPKISLVLGPWAQSEFFFNAGRGMHSNDARGTTDPLSPVPGIVASQGIEFGARTQVIPGLQSSLAIWRLNFDSELVYVGDAGSTEPNIASKRHGVEWNNRYTPVQWLLVDADFAWSHARFVNGERIPNAVDKVASVALTLRDLGPWSASVQGRYLGSSALVEDNSVRSNPSFTTNLRLARQFGRGTALTLDLFNLGNRKVNDIEYFYESQLPGESAPVADKHVHPAEPRTLRLTLRTEF